MTGDYQNMLEVDEKVLVSKHDSNKHRTNREGQKYREGHETRDNNRRKAMSNSIGK